jgi:hypothetical protein
LWNSKKPLTGTLSSEAVAPRQMPIIRDYLGEPQTPKELGMSPGLMDDLILRLIRQEGEVSVRVLMDTLCLGLKMLDAVLLRVQQALNGKLCASILFSVWRVEQSASRRYCVGNKSPNTKFDLRKLEKSRAATESYLPVYSDGRILRKLAVDGFRTSQHANSLMVSFRCSTFAIRKSESNPSGTVLEKLIIPGKNHRPFHI